MMRQVFLIGFFLLAAVLLLSSTGCRWGKPLKPLTPSQFRSGELSRIGNAALEKGDLEEAEKKLEEAVKLNKKDAELRRHYAEALWIRGKHQESLEQLLEASKRGGAEDASLHLSLAEKYLDLNNLTAAYRHAEEAVRFAPKQYKSWALRGKANWYLAEQQRYAASLEQGREESFQSVEKARRYLFEARNDYYRALTYAPDNHKDILPELAAVQMHCGQAEHALATWQNLQELFPQEAVPADVFRGKAEAYVALGRFDEAATNLQAARNREPNRMEIERRLQEVVAMAQNQVR